MPEDHLGSLEDWELATNGLRHALDELGMPYVVNEGDGAFYGPKIDFHLEDSLGRTWQCGTIQLDFQLPMRFDAEYTAADGQKRRPIMIHRVVFGSIERFIGILIEHYAGKFPMWLAPVQVKVITITDRANGYAAEITDALKARKIRAELDCRSESANYKIRAAQLEKIPYMLVIGDREVENGTVSVRTRDGKVLGGMTLDAFGAMAEEEIRTKKS